MSDKRRDKNGRVLKTGESQRKDGLYSYRFTEANKKRQTIYAKDLMELRKKEDEISLLRRDNIDYTGGTITVNELLERYTSLRRGVRHSTLAGYQFVTNLVKQQPFGHRKIRDIRVSDAKLWLIDLFEQGYSYGSIASIRGVVKPAFQMAVAHHISHVIQRLRNKYNETHVIPMPLIMPHSFRYTTAIPKTRRFPNFKDL